MKLKLTQEELNVLIVILQESHQARFNTTFEAKLSGEILKEFLISLMKKSMDLKEKRTISLDKKTLLVLNQVLPQLHTDHPYTKAILSPIITKVNQQCLSI
jgi:hypothetical protein